MSDYERLAAAEGLLPGPGYQEGFEAGYERCKQDATTAIKAVPNDAPGRSRLPESARELVLAVVAALDATHTQGGREDA